MLLTNNASIELHSHRHPSMVGNRVQTDKTSDYSSVEGVCYYNIAVRIASIQLKIETFSIQNLEDKGRLPFSQRVENELISNLR